MNIAHSTRPASLYSHRAALFCLVFSVFFANHLSVPLKQVSDILLQDAKSVAATEDSVVQAARDISQFPAMVLPKPVKKIKAKRHIKKIDKEVVFQSYVDKKIEEGIAASQSEDVVEVLEPVQDIVTQKLAEELPAEKETFATNDRYDEELLPHEEKYLEVVGTIQPNHYDVIQASQNTALKSLNEVAKNVLVAAAPILTTLPVKAKAAQVASVAAPAPALVVPTTKKPSIKAIVQLEKTPESQQVKPTLGEKLEGDVIVEPELATWLQANQGHIELYLHPEGSRDNKESLFLDYQYPEKGFFYDSRELKGTYRLVAGVFTAKAAAPFAQVEYSEVITQDTAKKKLIFEIGKKDLKQIHNQKASLVVTLLRAPLPQQKFYESSGEDLKRPIEKARVKIVGMPEAGSPETDQFGSIRFPNVPKHSELFLKIEAPGYYTSYQIVPVADMAVYRTIYLVEKRENSPTYVAGRVFDPQTRNELSGQTVELAFRKAPTNYFDDNRFTGQFGTFGFSGVKPQLRAIERNGKQPFAFLLRPESAAFYEFGNGGKKTLSAKIVDPFSNTPVSAKFHVLGSQRWDYESDGNGVVQFPEIDFPTGLVTLEAQMPDNQLIWYNLSYDPIQREKTRRLFAVPKDIVEELLKKYPYSNNAYPNNQTGMLFGGAEAPLFRKTKGCVHPMLVNEQEQEISTANGPFPFQGEVTPQKRLCLSADKPGFFYRNVPPGEYLLKWTTQKGKTIKSRVVRIGAQRVAVSVN